MKCDCKLLCFSYGGLRNAELAVKSGGEFLKDYMNPDQSWSSRKSGSWTCVISYLCRDDGQLKSFSIPDLPLSTIRHNKIIALFHIISFSLNWCARSLVSIFLYWFWRKIATHALYECIKLEGHFFLCCSFETIRMLMRNITDFLWGRIHVNISVSTSTSCRNSFAKRMKSTVLKKY